MANEVKDTGYAAQQWAFDAEVTRVFDDMIARSIPQYEVMRQAVADLASRYVAPETSIVDLGCSRGEAIAPLVERFRGTNNKFVGFEKSQPMIAACQERFGQQIALGEVEIRDADLRLGMPKIKASVVLSVLTLQFVPIEYRQQLVRSVFDSLYPGGAFIVVEKILGGTATTDRDFVDLYYDMKRRHGYSQEEIDRKKFSLEGVLVPVTAKWNEEMLTSAGFRIVECFWRWMNFAGWVAIK